ncbi:hypothetical protein BJ742DRAFT_812835 [Cladochytrium replicatum]|nr:hypothetical protein BJ742DRAFT_812835 [Cladochytrium replicatum]
MAVERCFGEALQVESSPPAHRTRRPHHLNEQPHPAHSQQRPTHSTLSQPHLPMRRCLLLTLFLVFATLVRAQSNPDQPPEYLVPLDTSGNADDNGAGSQRFDIVLGFNLRDATPGPLISLNAPGGILPLLGSFVGQNVLRAANRAPEIMRALEGGKSTRTPYIFPLRDSPPEAGALYDINNIVTVAIPQELLRFPLSSVGNSTNGTAPTVPSPTGSAAGAVSATVPPPPAATSAGGGGSVNSPVVPPPASTGPVDVPVVPPPPPPPTTTSVVPKPSPSPSPSSPGGGSGGGGGGSGGGSGSQTNYQLFKGAQYGIAPLPVLAGGRGYYVPGDPAGSGASFLNVQEGRQRSCDIQKNQCADYANRDNNPSTTVAPCETQHSQCIGRLNGRRRAKKRAITGDGLTITKRLIATARGATSIVVDFWCYHAPDDLCDKVASAYLYGANVLAQTVNTRYPITIAASFQSYCLQRPECSNTTIGSAFPFSFWTLKNVRGADSKYWYPQALAKQIAWDRFLDWNAYDIMVQFNWDFHTAPKSGLPPGFGRFWFPEDGTPILSGQYDFRYSVLHELLHGFGLLSSWGAHLPDLNSPSFALPVLSPMYNILATENATYGSVAGAFPLMIADKYMYLVNRQSAPDVSPDTPVVGPLKTFTILTSLSRYEPAFTVGILTTDYPVFDRWYSTFLANSAYTVGQALYRLATAPNTTIAAIPQGVRIRDNAAGTGIIRLVNNSIGVLLHTGFDPFRPSRSLNHFDSDFYRGTEEFLARPQQVSGRTVNRYMALQAYVTKYGNATGSPNDLGGTVSGAIKDLDDEVDPFVDAVGSFLQPVDPGRSFPVGVMTRMYLATMGWDVNLKPNLSSIPPALVQPAAGLVVNSTVVSFGSRSIIPMSVGWWFLGALVLVVSLQ